MLQWLRKLGRVWRFPLVLVVLALAYLIDPTYATDVKEMWVDVDCTWGPSYGRTLGYEEERPAKLLQKAKVVRRFDNERFFKLFVDLMTRPVPVRPD